MSGVTRRDAIGGLAMAAAAIRWGGAVPAHAAAPQIGRQAPGFYRYKVGDIEVSVVADGARTFPLPDTFIANAKREEINAALEAAYLPKDAVTIYFSPIVVNTGTKLVVIDTGFGPAAAAQAGSTAGLFLTNLAAAGIDAKAVDAVIISHYHQDHVDGLVGAEGKPAFPNAEVLVPAPEHKFWMDDGEMSRAAPGRMAGLFKNNRRIFGGEVGKRVATYEWGKEVVPGVTAFASPGHTPGHTSYIIASGAQKVFVQSDVTNNPALFVRNPGWQASFDQDGGQAVETRRKVYDMLVAEKMLVQGFHYPFPALGHVEKDAGGYRLAPVHWSQKL
jgi:glyoxylase-like metal-dependent hydrolase (beta-lactamase superfamily II)